MQKFKVAVVLSLVLAMAGSAMANTFRAADQVYVLAASSRIAGAAGAIFNQDVTITNVTNDRVVVDVAISQGQGDNSQATAAANTRRLATLNPNERRTITDFAAVASGLGFGTTVVNGFYIFFGCREGGSCAGASAVTADFRNITVESRVYTGSNCTTDGVTRPCTFGNNFPGHAWYSYAAQGAPAGLDRVLISGVVNTGVRGESGFRSNIGLINASQYSTTILRTTVFSESGTQIGSLELTLGPLGRTQPGVTAFNAAGFTGNGYVIVEQVGVTPTADAAANNCADGCPGFFAYGVSIDNVSNDPTTLEGQFLGPLTPEALAVLYPVPGKAQRRAARRR